MKRDNHPIPEFAARRRRAVRRPRTAGVRPGQTAARGQTAVAPPLQQPVIVATADPSLVRMLTFALDQARLPHECFSSGTVVLRELLALPVGPRPPIVILDADLPGMDGYAILERLAVARPDTFLLVVLSSHADESVQVRSLLAGALDHLAKPFNIRVLIAKVQRWATLTAQWRGAA